MIEPSELARAAEGASSGPARAAAWIERRSLLVALLIVAAALAARAVPAAIGCYLNPDEAMHAIAASVDGLGAAYENSKGFAHPPLYITALSPWTGLGSDPFHLRAPSLVLAMLAGLLAFLWMRRLAGPAAAITGTAALAASPAFTSLASEVRQYAPLLFFVAGASWALELALDRSRKSARAALMAWLLFGAFQLGAVLSHYTAAPWTGAIGLLALGRLLARRESPSRMAPFVVVQLVLASVYVTLWFTHAAEFRDRQAHVAVEGYLQRAYFDPAERSLPAFLFDNLRDVFRYHVAGTWRRFTDAGRIAATTALVVAAIGLARFALGFGGNLGGGPHRRARRHVALHPVLVFDAAALAGTLGLLPFTGTRHATALLPSSALLIGAGLTCFLPARTRALGATVFAVLVLPAWLAWAPADNRPSKTPRADLEKTLRYLASVPPRDSRLAMDLQTEFTIRAHLAPREREARRMQRAVSDRLDLDVVFVRWPWRLLPDNLDETFERVGTQAGLSSGRSFDYVTLNWFGDVGTEAALRERMPDDVSRLRRFGEILVFQGTVPREAR